MRVAEGLYYYGARYLDPKYSMWLSTDPALGEYIPGLDKDKNKNLPGMGGLFNQINANLFHAFGNNPITYTDPDGSDILKAVEIVKNKNTLSSNTKSVLSGELINNLYKAEYARMNLLEKIGIDGSSIGRGQVTKSAYDDVLKIFSEELSTYCSELNIKLTKDFKKDMKESDLEDFFVTAYLALCIEGRQKEGRSAEDAAKFGIGFYHGAYKMIKNAQDKDPNKISFAGTEKALRTGNKKEQDLLNYINEVYCEGK